MATEDNAQVQDEEVKGQNSPDVQPDPAKLPGEGAEYNLDKDPNDPRAEKAVPQDDDVSATKDAPAPADTAGTVEEAPEPNSRENAKTEDGTPANTAAIVTNEDVEQHLDVDPNDPRNVPQPNILPNFTDKDQQGSSPKE